MPWDEFKASLHKNIGDSYAFIVSIWSKFKKNSQYQRKDEQDWASDLKYLQSILQKFDLL